MVVESEQTEEAAEVFLAVLASARLQVHADGFREGPCIGPDKAAVRRVVHGCHGRGGRRHGRLCLAPRSVLVLSAPSVRGKRLQKLTPPGQQLVLLVLVRAPVLLAQHRPQVGLYRVIGQLVMVLQCRRTVFLIGRHSHSQVGQIQVRRMRVLKGIGIRCVHGPWTFS